MFCLDQHLPKTDYLGKGGHFYMGIMAGNRMRDGVMSLMVTSSGGYGVLAGNWLWFGYNPGGTLGICPSKLLRNRGGTRADGWMDDRRQDGHSSVSLEDRDTCNNCTHTHSWLY